MKHTVVLTGAFPGVARDLLSQEFDVVEHPDEERTAEQLATILSEADAALVLASDPVTREVLEECPNLRIVVVFDQRARRVDLEAARQLSVTVAVVPLEGEEEKARGSAIEIARFFSRLPPLHPAG